MELAAWQDWRENDAELIQPRLTDCSPLPVPVLDGRVAEFRVDLALTLVLD